MTKLYPDTTAFCFAESFYVLVYSRGIPSRNSKLSSLQMSVGITTESSMSHLKSLVSKSRKLFWQFPQQTAGWHRTKLICSTAFSNTWPVITILRLDADYAVCLVRGFVQHPFVNFFILLSHFAQSIRPSLIPSKHAEHLPDTIQLLLLVAVTGNPHLRQINFVDRLYFLSIFICSIL